MKYRKISTVLLKLENIIEPFNVWVFVSGDSDWCSTIATHELSDGLETCTRCTNKVNKSMQENSLDLYDSWYGIYLSIR